MRHAPALLARQARLVPAAAAIVALASLGSCGGGGSTAPKPRLVVHVPTNPIPSGTSVQATAWVISGSDSTVATNVTWASAVTAVASVSQTGVITGALQGPVDITASSGGLSTTFRVTIMPGAAATVNIYTGNGQFGPAGSQLPAPLCTTVKDAAGNLILQIAVTYTVATGGGHIDPPTQPKTDQAGIATSGLWTLGSAKGEQTVVASVPGATSVTFTAQAK